MPQALTVHPAADLFPLLPQAELQELADDIKKNGQRLPISIWRDQIVDGRNRYAACQIACVEPIFLEEDFADDAAVARFVVSVNLKRRHLNESQRSMIASRLANMVQGARTDLPQICGMSQEDAADLLNVSPRSVSDAKAVQRDGATELIAAVDAGEVAVSTAAVVAELPRERQREIVARGEAEILKAAKEIRANKSEERRQERVAKIVEISKSNRPLEAQQLAAVVLCDPPWRYEHAESESRAIENQYPTMPLEEICALNVRAICTPDTTLFMWTTSPKLRESFTVLEAWGFNYRTCAVWDKKKIGMGYYFRQAHELLLVATLGTPPTPAPGARVSSVISIERGEHSAKPVEVYEIIEAMYPELPKLEMFCRSPRNGWMVWGNQSA